MRSGVGEWNVIVDKGDEAAAAPIMGAVSAKGGVVLEFGGVVSLPEFCFLDEGGMDVVCSE